MEYGKVVGVGRTATAYEWGEGKVLKLFYQGYPKGAAEREFHNAKIIENMSFAKPKAHDVIICDERIGIIYDKVEGESLLDWVMRTHDIEKCAEYMANLHKSIIRSSTSNLPNYKDFLKHNIENIPSADSKKLEEAFQMLDKLPEGDALCHGDFHPGNILLSKGNPMVIDFMNLCHGDPMYDVARTVFLVQYTPVPMEAEDREMLLRFKKTLADLYLIEMNVTREMIRDYLSVIFEARRGECPEEISQ